MHQVIFPSPACGGAKENIAAYSSLKYRLCANNFRPGGLPGWPHEQQFSDARPFCCAVWHSNVTAAQLHHCGKKKVGSINCEKWSPCRYHSTLIFFDNAHIFYAKPKLFLNFG